MPCEKCGRWVKGVDRPSTLHPSCECGALSASPACSISASPDRLQTKKIQWLIENYGGREPTAATFYVQTRNGIAEVHPFGKVTWRD